MRTTTRRRPALTAEQRRRAELLTKRLTVFRDFADLRAYYATMSGGYRATLRPTAPALVASWTPAELVVERAERDLATNLAHLIDLAEASGPRRVVVVRQAKRAA